MFAAGLPAVFLFGAAALLLSVMAAPLLIRYPLSGLPAEFWFAVVASACLDAPGNVLLARSFGLSDLSVVGPLSCLKPLVAMVFAAVWLAEAPSFGGVLGAAVVVAGSLLLVSESGATLGAALRALGRDPGVQARALSMLMTSGASVFSKQAILVASAEQAFLAWAFLSVPIVALLWVILRRGRLAADLRAGRAYPGLLLGLAALFLPLALSTVWVLDRLQVGYALALFQLSAVLNVLIGGKLFGERQMGRRLAAAGVMVAGGGVLLWSR